MRRSSINAPFGSLLALLLVAVHPLPAMLRAQTNAGLPKAVPVPAAKVEPETIRFERNLPGDAKPIVISADDLATWVEGNRTVVLMRGRVLVQQSYVQARFEQGVAFVDNDRYRRSGIWSVSIYAEGQVHLDTSEKTMDGSRGVLDLFTRGELKLHSQGNRILRQPLVDEPLVLRGRTERPANVANARAPATQSPLRQTSTNEAPEPPVPYFPPGLRAPGGLPPAPAPVAPSDANLPPVRPPGSAPTSPAPMVPPATTGPAPPGTNPRISNYFQPAATPTPGIPAPGPPQFPSATPGAPRPTQTSPPPPGGPLRQSIVIRPRTSKMYDLQQGPATNGEKTLTLTGGIILQVRNVPSIGMLDMEADQCVVWIKGGNDQQLFNKGTPSGEGNQGEYEFYLKGNVEIRREDIRESQVMKADEVYYDASRNTAVALSALLELKEKPKPGKTVAIVTDPIYFRADEIQQLTPTQFRVLRSEVFSSKLPSDPGLKSNSTDTTIDEKVVPKTSLFGTQVTNRVTGEQIQDRETLIHSRNVFFELEDVPFFYLPVVNTNANDPLGPVQSINFGFSQIFGFDIGVSLDAYNLFGIQPLQDTRWRLDVDYLSYRGPTVASGFDYSGKEVFGTPGKYEGFVKSFAMTDRNYDILGGARPINDFDPTNFRGRLTWRQNVYDLPDGFSVQSQLSALSDRNFLEAYFKQEFDTDINQETFVYLKQQEDNWAYTVLIEDRIRRWVNETESLPQLNGYLLGVSLFDRFTSNTRGNIGYYRLQTTTDQEPQVSSTDIETATGRASVYEELSYPLDLGPVKAVPYVKGAVMGYTDDLNNEATGRAWGGFGLRASMPLTRLFPDIKDDLFNINGINHKIVFSANYFYSQATEPYNQLPQLDRLNDDATDQSLRDIRPQLPYLNPANGYALANSPMFDPQMYAIRRLLDNHIDTIDSIEALQLDIRQRWQTKRGYPGVEHIVDWMTLDLSGTYFPRSTLDGYDKQWAFVQYDYTWNIGDRTTFVSSGWIDPVDEGARVFTVGMYFNRPDRTNFYFGYRLIDPVDSKALTASVTYIFSPKYAMTASATYDFGTQQSLSNTLVMTRIGSDLQVSAGITYNALTQTIGAVFEIVPNLVPNNRGPGAINSSALAR